MATGADVVTEVQKFLGDPYVYGSAGPTTFDCSGLVQYVYGQLGVNTPRVSSEQWSWLKQAGNTSQDKSQLFASPGDLIFSQWPGDDATPGHVGIFIGGHQLIEAPKPGGKVQLATIDQYYFDHIYGVGHVGALSMPAGTTAQNLDPSSYQVYVTDGTGQFPGTPSTGKGGGGILSWLSQGPMEKALAGNPNPSGDSLGLAGPIDALTSSFSGFSKVMYTLTLPSTWARIGAGLIGSLLLIFGLWHLGKDMARNE